MTTRRLISTIALGAMLAGPATAGEWFNLDGSFGEDGFDRYVPPITNPLFNETPFITTEVKPFYAYHELSDDFPGGGGDVQVVGMQARLALTERLGFIATSDGYTWIDFDSTLEDDDGLNDIAVGLKYALVNRPESGEILTAGLRYTAPVGGLETGAIELNGVGDGFINPFLTGAFFAGKSQLQGSVGVQAPLSDENWTFAHASLHADTEILPGLFPMVEVNAIMPLDGGDRLTAAPLNKLTGTDIVDPGASDPDGVVTVGGGVRYRLTDNLIFGVGGDYNVLEDGNHVHGWRVLTDLVVHF